MSTQLDRIERSMKIMERRVEAMQRDILRMKRVRTPIAAGDKVVMISPYKGNLLRGTGTVFYVNSWYWRVNFGRSSLSVPKSQASKHLEVI